MDGSGGCVPSWWVLARTSFGGTSMLTRRFLLGISAAEPSGGGDTAWPLFGDVGAIAVRPGGPIGVEFDLTGDTGLIGAVTPGGGVE